MSAEKQDFYYLRLSKEDGDIEEGSAEESCSITSQRDCIKRYLQEHRFQADKFEETPSGRPLMFPRWDNIVEIADDGYSGTSMNRPGMRRLLNLVENSKVRTIIVRDLSRFARNYLEAGHYLEFVFPAYGVRFISINDQFDSEQLGENTAGLELAIKNLLNQMWRNGCINDTYEPGSTFKVITAASCLEEGVVSLNDNFSCPGYRIVEDRKIRCHKVGGHGAETFVKGIQNSCNPVFIEIGLRLGTDNFYKYFEQFGLMGMTGVDLPGEAGTIMHKKENVGQVELATMSFGQSFQITPMQLATTVSSIVNGGERITPHFGVSVLDREGEEVKRFKYGDGKRIVSKETSETMKKLLESVVSEGSGKNAYVEGYHIGGKTATSQTLPRSANKYISSFVGFAPADNPQVLGMCVIYNPQGVYYGGTIAAPVVKNIFENVLPYLGIEKE